MEASLRCWFCDVTAFTQSLIPACVICLTGLKARFQRAVLPALASELRVTSKVQESQESARTRARRF